MSNVRDLHATRAHAPARRMQALVVDAAHARTEISLPVLGLVALTRGMLGAGLAMLVAGRFDPAPRKAVGWTLTAVGVLTTAPLLLEVFGRRTKRP